MSCSRMRSPEFVVDDQGNKFEGPQLHASYDVGGEMWHLVSDGGGPRILRPNRIDANVYTTATLEDRIPEQIEKDFNEGPEPIDFTAPSEEKQPEDPSEENPQSGAGGSTNGASGSGDGDPSSPKETSDGDGSTGESETDNADSETAKTEGASA